jgi:hypothetical protein
LELSGKGWRLPNVVELRTILDRQAKSGAFNAVAFPKTMNNVYATASSCPSKVSAIWTYNAVLGSTDCHGVEEVVFSVRCVR